MRNPPPSNVNTPSKSASTTTRMRMTHAGPRLQFLEMLLILDVVLIAGSLLAGAHLLSRGQETPAAVLLALGTLLLLLTLSRVRRVQRLRRLGRAGRLATARITGRRRRRLSTAPRADGFWPTAGQPFFPVTEVTYVFEDEEGRQRTGAFMVTADAADGWSPGQTIEIYHEDSKACFSCPSLVLRWYFRLGGALPADELPAGLRTSPLLLEAAWGPVGDEEPSGKR